MLEKMFLKNIMYFENVHVCFQKEKLKMQQQNKISIKNIKYDDDDNNNNSTTSSSSTTTTNNNSNNNNNHHHKNNSNNMQL